MALVPTMPISIRKPIRALTPIGRPVRNSAGKAPIVASGGHSQEWEPGSRDLSAFLARLRAAADPRALDGDEREKIRKELLARNQSLLWESWLAGARQGAKVDVSGRPPARPRG